jgi:Cys-tRNA(Pro)/Cys-tRNA(Cys) deacylase
MAKQQKKTNVMRILDAHGIAYAHYAYESADNMIDGVTVARLIGKDPAIVYKTLVTVGKTGAYYVFVLPVAAELDLKKAAAAVHEKKIDMIPVKQITPVTGYIKGGCSPVGMKKLYDTVFDISTLSHSAVIFNGGKVGTQVEIDPNDIIKVVPCRFEDICAD